MIIPKADNIICRHYHSSVSYRTGSPTVKLPLCGMAFDGITIVCRIFFTKGIGTATSSRNENKVCFFFYSTDTTVNV